MEDYNHNITNLGLIYVKKYWNKTNYDNYEGY